MSIEKFISSPEIEEAVKETAIIQYKWREEIYNLLENDDAFRIYILNRMAGIISEALVRLKMESTDEVNNE